MARPGLPTRRSGRGLFEDAPRKFLFNFLVFILSLEFINETNLITQTWALKADAPAMSPSQGWRPVRPMVSQSKVGISIALHQHRQKKLYSSPSALSSVHPPISAPSYSSIAGASELSFYSSDLSDLVQHSRRSAADVPAHVDAAPPDAASNTSAAPSGLVEPPVSPHNGCCAPNMVQRRGSQDCHCVYPVRVELFLHNISLNSNWSNEFLDDLASQLNLRVTQFEIVNFYAVGASGLNMTMDIAPHTGNSFSSNQVAAMNYSLSMHTVWINPVLVVVGDYNLLNLTWFRSLAPAPAASPLPTPSVEIPPASIGPISKKSSIASRVPLILAPVGGFILLTMLIIFILLKCKRRTQHQEMNEEEEFGELQGAPTRFTFQQLKVATEQFKEKIGEGGFGSVFKGQFAEESIAVKRLDRAGQGKREFSAEVETIGSIHHINLVRLIGFCAEKSHRLLVYEYMPKGSLDRWIYSRHDNNAPTLDWSMRQKIITHIAKGLSYLHEGCTKKIAHLDVKPQNILLDDNFDAKLSDFGLCKLIDRDMSQVVTRMRGTPGYLAPEWLTSHITEKADVYSFGVVVMEVVSGRKNLDTSRSEGSIHLITLLEEKVKSDQLVDLIDNNSYDMQAHKQDAIRMMTLAMWCLQIDCKKRPKMSEVVTVLQGTMDADSNIDYNFVTTGPANFGNAENVNSSAPPLNSDVSGPR